VLHLSLEEVVMQILRTLNLCDVVLCALALRKAAIMLVSIVDGQEAVVAESMVYPAERPLFQVT